MLPLNSFHHVILTTCDNRANSILPHILFLMSAVLVVVVVGAGVACEAMSLLLVVVVVVVPPPNTAKNCPEMCNNGLWDYRY